MKIEHERQFKFHPERDFAADFRINWTKILVEVEGGTRMARIINGRPVAIGRHSTGADYEKRAWAAILGWVIIPVTPRMTETGKAIEFIELALEHWRQGNGE